MGSGPGEDSVVQQQQDVEALRARQQAAGITKPTIQNTNVPPEQQPVGQSSVPEQQTIISTRNEATPGKRYSKDELGIMKFPLDIEEKNMPYVLFKIFETQTTGATTAQNNSEQSYYTGMQKGAEAAAAVENAVNNATGGVTGAVIGAASDTATTIINATGNALGVQDIVGQAKNAFKNFSFSRNTEQLALAIALFMPEGLNTSYEHQYDEVSLTATLGGAGMFAQALSAKDGGVGAIDPFIIEAASKVAGALPGLQSSQELTSLLVFGTTGKAINPQLEMLYNSPRLRTFTFDFRLVPRNYSEAQQIRNIIQMFKKYSAPEIPSGSTGRYFIPPSRFEIEFYHRNELNTNLFKTKQCVLENVTIDYAPNGYATHYDGQPIETRLSLIFRETTIIDKNAVEEGY